MLRFAGQLRRVFGTNVPAFGPKVLHQKQRGHRQAKDGFIRQWRVQPPVHFDQGRGNTQAVSIFE